MFEAIIPCRESALELEAVHVGYTLVTSRRRTPVARTKCEQETSEAPESGEELQLGQHVYRSPHLSGGECV